MSTFRFFVPLAIVLAGCSAEPSSPAIEVNDAWARATAAGQSSGAIYATIVNRGAADTLTGVASDGGIAMLHASETQGGISRMRMVEAMPIAAGSKSAAQTVKLAPGGTHVMLTGLSRPLIAGDNLNLTLRFAKAGERDVAVSVVAPGAR